jgi:peptide/nickel transport system substrate-binding protein
MSIKNTIYTLLFIFFVIVIFSIAYNLYNKKTVYKNQLTVHMLSDAKGLNPVTVSDASSKSYILLNIMQSMLAYDYKTFELVPVLAIDLPEVKDVGDNIEVTYEIRREAVWDNGYPVTVEDVLFSYKAILCPRVNSDNLRSAVDFVKDIKTYSDNPKKFTVICSKNISIVESTGYDVKILPEYVYDFRHLLKKYSIAELAIKNPKCKDDVAIKEFANFFNSNKTMRDTNYVKGSGAYKFVSWETGRKLVIERKKNWWGDKLNEINQYFVAYPKRIEFLTITNTNTALTALKDEKLDFMVVSPVKEFIDLDYSPKFTRNYYKSEPEMLGYVGIGINHKDKILQDINVRKALSYLINIDQIINKVLLNGGVRTNSAILPIKKNIINPTIKPYPYNLKVAIELLKVAGWKDTDGNGILDKIIDGKKTNFEISFAYNTNPLREMIGLLMQRSFYQAGIKLTLMPLDWSLLQDELKKHNFQLWYASWYTTPGVDDNKQLFHTSSANGGNNYGSFGNAQTDKLLDDIRVEMDSSKRKELYYQWQEIEHEQIPYIYLYVQKYRNCIHKRFENKFIGSGGYPGIWFAGFKEKKNYK